VQSARCQTNDGITWLDRLAVDQPVSIDDADTESRHVEFARRVDVGHDRRFAAEERRTRLHATF
jgi:hypothetical protein